MHISAINYQSNHYPALLRDITSPPPKLFYRGQLPPERPTVAIVGSRRTSTYGRNITYRLASELAAAGVTIVSGLALGVDSVAHLAALDAGGITVAVLACGLDQVYPHSNRGLAERITERGAVISDYPERTQPLRHHFPARNRLIAGLSHAVIITEAAAKSGALITANFALEQNRQVMAVPGNITSPLSAGPNNLIKAGALPITDSSDVLAALDLEYSAQSVQADSREEALILELLAKGVNSTQRLIEESGLAAGQFANIISLMEISGKVRNLGAGNWVTR